MATHQKCYICGQHFEKSCFVVRSEKRGHRLYDHAVPTIFQHLLITYKECIKEEITKEMTMLDTEPTIPVPSPSKVAYAIGAE